MNNDNLLQLEGAIESVVFRNDENGYTVIELADGDDYLTAVGIMPQVSSGDVVKLTGKYTNHPSYGRQFAVQICEISRPTEAADLSLVYCHPELSRESAPQTAQRLVFGIWKVERTLRACELACKYSLHNVAERGRIHVPYSTVGPSFNAVKAEHHACAGFFFFLGRVRIFHKTLCERSCPVMH